MGGFSDIFSGIATLAGSKARSPGGQIASNANATARGWAETAPLGFGLNQIYSPAYLGLGSQNLQSLLFGSPAQTINREIGFGKRMADGSYKRSVGITEELPETVGFFDLLGQAAPRLQELYQTGARQGVQNQLGLLNEFLPQAQEFQRQSNPELMDLQRLIGTTASQGLSMGSRWNPSDLGRETNRIRSDWANRGLGSGQSAQMDEILQILGGGEALRSQRQNYALNANNSLSATQPDYLRMILGLGGNPVGDAMQLVGGQQPMANQFQQYSPYNASATSTGNQAAQLQFLNRQARAQAVGDVAGGALDMIAGAYTGGMGGMFGGG